MQQPRWTRDNPRMITRSSVWSGRLRDQALRLGLHAFKDADEEESGSHKLDDELDDLSISSNSDDLYSAAGKSAGDGGGCRPGAGDGAGVTELAVHSAKGEYTRSSATQLMPGSESNHGKPREPSEIQATEMRSDARVEDARLSASVNSSTARSTTVYRPPTEPQPRPDHARMALYTTGVHGIDTTSKGKCMFSDLTKLEREVGPFVPLLESGSAADQERSAMERWKNNNRLLLEAIRTHAAACPEILCSIPFSLIFNEIEDKEFERLLAELKVRYFTGIHIFSSEANEQYHALMEPYAKSQPLENVDWEGMSRMGHFSNTFLARHIDGPTVELWTITKVYLHNSAGYHANLEGILSKLKGNPCEQIIPHLWYVAQETHLYICTRYEGESEDHHHVCDGNNEVSDVVRWYNQLQEAADFLHQQKILYLNWKTSAVLIRKDYHLVKLLNFTCAGDLDVNLEEHLENIHMFLHPLILPPEVQVHPRLQRATDYWGLGCLVYELLTGHKVHHNLRHWAPEEIRAHLSRDPWVDLSEISNLQMRSLLQQCFQVDPLKRNPPHKLQEQPDQVPQSETSPHRDIHMSGNNYEASDWDDNSSMSDLQISDDED